jgi:hypothetical protein
MTYKRFSLPGSAGRGSGFARGKPPQSDELQTVASVATVAGPNVRVRGSQLQTVATVASVATPKLDSEGQLAPDMPASQDLGLATVATLATLPPGWRAAAALGAYERMTAASGARASPCGRDLLNDFLTGHLEEAQRLGWTDMELFGCHPEPAFALERYDLMGAALISAVMAWHVTSVSVDEIRSTNGLASRRRPSGPVALMWNVFR